MEQDKKLADAPKDADGFDLQLLSATPDHASSLQLIDEQQIQANEEQVSGSKGGSSTTPPCTENVPATKSTDSPQGAKEEPVQLEDASIGGRQVIAPQTAHQPFSFTIQQQIEPNEEQVSELKTESETITPIAGNVTATKSTDSPQSAKEETTELVNTNSLILMAQNGDKDAQGRLWTSKQATAKQAVLRIVQHEQDVEDIVQDVFVLMCRSLNQLRNPNAFDGWLSTIASRLALKHVVMKSLTTSIDRISTLCANDINAEAAAIIKESSAVVWNAMDKTQQWAFYLQKVDALPSAACATLLGMEEGQFRTYWCRVKAKLKDKFPDIAGQHDDDTAKPSQGGGK